MQYGDKQNLKARLQLYYIESIRTSKYYFYYFLLF